MKIIKKVLVICIAALLLAAAWPRRCGIRATLARRS